MRIRIFMVILITLTSCAPAQSGSVSSAPPIILPRNNITPVAMTSYTRSEYGVYFMGESSGQARLEPETGCYLGAYVPKGNDINELDTMIGKQHALSVRGMRLGEEFPYEWVLECAAAMKTPYIIVGPPNNYNYFQEVTIEAAKDFGQFPFPIFVDFYPNPQSYTNDSDAYVQFYRKARETFADYAPNAVFVASVDAANVYDYCLYYPGNEFADWVGISIYRPLYENGSVNLRNYMKDLDYFYAAFQREKPIIISQLAFSFYSTADHRYASKEAAGKLSEFYSKLQTDYTRVKAVNYMNYNNITGSPKNAERDNFSITQDDTMLSAYRKAVSEPHYISETLNNDLDTVPAIEMYKSFFMVYEDENFKYLPEIAFADEGVELLGIESVSINDEVYYSTEKLLKAPGITCYIDDTNKRVVIEKKK